MADFHCWRFCCGALCVWLSCFIVYKGHTWRAVVIAIILGEIGTALFISGAVTRY